jgi:membrane protein DedA with SNARE-associated domain
MSAIIDFITNFLTSFAERVSLPVFMFVGAVAEEIVAIIPSPFVPLTAGSMAVQQGKTLGFLFFLALVGAVAKVMASSLVFYLSDKLEDILTRGKLGKFLGLESDDIERYGKMFSKGAKDEIIMIALRALPFVPTLPVTIVAGLIKMNFRSFAISTLIGIYLRNIMYLLAAFYGVKQFQGLLDSFDTVNLILEVGVILLVLGGAFLFLRKNWDRWFDLNKSKNKKKAK